MLAYMHSFQSPRSAQPVLGRPFVQRSAHLAAWAKTHLTGEGDTLSIDQRETCVAAGAMVFPGPVRRKYLHGNATIVEVMASKHISSCKSHEARFFIDKQLKFVINWMAAISSIPKLTQRNRRLTSAASPFTLDFANFAGCSISSLTRVGHTLHVVWQPQLFELQPANFQHGRIKCWQVTWIQVHTSCIDCHLSCDCKKGLPQTVSIYGYIWSNVPCQRPPTKICKT